jgi:hypothetical protein
MEFAYKNGTVINPNKDVVSEDGIKHPGRILTDWSRDELRAIGVVPYRVIYENRDSVLYVLSDAVTNISEDEVTVTHGGIERSLADAIAGLITSIKMEAEGRLSRTDWYVIRLVEKSTIIPAKITTYRDAVRAAVNAAEDQMKVTASISDLAAITISWPDEL